MSEDSKQQIISEIKRIAREQNLETLPRSVFKQNSNISENQIYKEFGSWNNAIEASGLNPYKLNEKKSIDELFENLLNVCIKYQKIPPSFLHDRKVYTKRFNSWNNTLSEFKKWLLENHPLSEFIDLIEENTTNNRKQIINNCNTAKKANEVVWQSKKGVVYGAPMDYEGLRHEPINEQGVVFLFGKIHEKLGITVEAVKTGFPDCEGKRLIDKNRNLWERVLIEFEYKSKNFLEHGHDPNKCDVIVCWEHNWTDCPLEVIELKTIINKNSSQIATSEASPPPRNDSHD